MGGTRGEDPRNSRAVSGEVILTLGEPSLYAPQEAFNITADAQTQPLKAARVTLHICGDTCNDNPTNDLERERKKKKTLHHFWLEISLAGLLKSCQSLLCLRRSFYY